MKSLRSFSLVFLAAALLFSGCTIKKRVYMPGYHVEWKHKAHTTGQSQNETKKEGEKDSNNHKDSDNHKEEKSRPIENHSIVEQEIGRTTLASTKNAEIPLSEYTESLKKQPENKYATKDISTTHSKKEMRRLKSESSVKDDDNGGVGKGIYMMLVGLLLVLLGYVFFLLLGTIGAIFWYIFAVAGSIIFLIGLIVLILALF